MLDKETPEAGTFKRKDKALWVVIGLIITTVAILLLKATGAGAQAPPPVEPCMQCHSIPGLEFPLLSGEKLKLNISPESFARSVHGSRLICSDCHAGYSTVPHPNRQIESRRAYTIAQYEVCKKCHFANYTKTLDSMHYEALQKGNQNAPVCTDCHTAHMVTRPDQPRRAISQSCSTCHTPIYNTYVASVHGKALVEEDNKDVPVCTDCHGVHNIHDPRIDAYRLDIPNLCARCHTDKGLMDKYDISTKVVQTYLSDFHGVTVSLRQKQSPNSRTAKAVCTDCHGVHEISRVKSVNSPVMKANLVKTCQKCHPDASANFPSAWLSHYEPSPHKAPVVYFVRLFYLGFIPFMIVGLSIHVMLNLWRAVTRR